MLLRGKVDVRNIDFPDNGMGENKLAENKHFRNNRWGGVVVVGHTQEKTRRLNDDGVRTVEAT